MFGQNFYPTPPDLVDLMLERVDLHRVKAVLEPSAGRGDIIERLLEKTRYGRSLEVDAIESDDELRMVLAGKGYRPIASDFLSFKSHRRYDLIIMNPPFSNGAEHLHKAMGLLRDGGQVVCLLNAETLKNPYTRRRQELVERIGQLDGRIDYVKDTFTQAARQTDVEVAIIYVDVPAPERTSNILERLIQAEEMKPETAGESADLVEGDYVSGAVRRYDIEVAAGLRLIDEYEALRPILSRSFSDKDRSMLELIIDGDKYANPRNKLVHCTRMKYWQELFQTREFGKLFTSKVRQDYENRIADLARYEFNVTNIKQMQLELSQAMLDNLDDAIVRLFDEFSSQYWDEQSNNIHYYNGWKTNKAYIVNRKVITHLYAYSYGSFDKWKVSEKMADIHKVFAYLDGKLSNSLDDLFGCLQALDWKTRGIELPYCQLSVYKKGTAHIVFKDERLLKKFNLIGSQRKGWLPPGYGKKSYGSMTAEERAVVDDFEGEVSYRDTVDNAEYYFSAAAPVLAIEAGAALSGLEQAS